MEKSDLSGLLWRTPAWLEAGRYAIAAAIVLGLTVVLVSVTGHEPEDRATAGPEDATLLDLTPGSAAPAASSIPLEGPPQAASAAALPPEATLPEAGPLPPEVFKAGEAALSPPEPSHVTPPVPPQPRKANEEQEPQEMSPAGSQPDAAVPAGIPSEPRRAAGLVLSRWQRALLGKLEKAKRGINAGGLNGTLTVEFTVGLYGQLLSAGISRSSGSPALDQKALTLLRRAAPFPAPPPGLSGEALRFTVPVAFVHGH